MPQSIEYQHIETGDAGIGQTVTEIAAMASRFSLDWEVIEHARGITRDVPARDKRAEADALFWWVKDNVKFYDDPLPAELLQSPKVTIASRGGDCDDLVILLASLNLAIGNDVAYVTVSLPGEVNFSHIFLLVFDCNGGEHTFYDPSVPESHPGWVPPATGRVRVWHPSGEYADYDSLSGFFSKVKDFFKKIEQKIRKEIKRSPIYEELKRFERKVRKEKERVMDKISREMSRIEEKLGPFGKFLVLGGKVALSVATGGLFAAPLLGVASAIAPGLGVVGTALEPALMTAAHGGSVTAFGVGQAAAGIDEAVTGSNPWALDEEEWKMLGQLALTISSGVLTVLSGGGAAPLLTASILSLASTALSAMELKEQLEQREELIDELKAQQTKLALEERAQREAIAKLEKDMVLIEELMQAQLEKEGTLQRRQLDYQGRVSEVRLSAEESVLAHEQELTDALLAHKQELLDGIHAKAMEAARSALAGVVTLKGEFLQEEQDILGRALTSPQELEQEIAAIAGEFLSLVEGVAL